MAAAAEPQRSDAGLADDPPVAEWDDALLFEVAVDPFRRVAASGKEDGRAAGRRDGYREGVDIGRSKGWEIGLELGYMHSFARGILEGCTEMGGEEKQGAPSTSDNPSDASQSSRQRTSHRLERCLTLAREIIKLADEFPDPDTLLSQSEIDGRAASANIDEREETICKSVASLALEDNGDGCCSAHNNQCSEKCSNGGSCCNNEDDAASNDGLNLQKEGDNTARPNPAAKLDVSAALERIRAKFKLLCVLMKTKQSFELKKILDLGKEAVEGGDSGARNAKQLQIDAQNEDGGTGDTKQRYESIEANAERRSDRNRAEAVSSAVDSDW